MMAGEALIRAGMIRMNTLLKKDPLMENAALWLPGIQSDGKAEEIEFEPWMNFELEMEENASI